MGPVSGKQSASRSLDFQNVAVVTPKNLYESVEQKLSMFDDGIASPDWRVRMGKKT